MCDVCHVAGARMYCRADSARLCLKCDQEVRVLAGRGGRE